MMAFLSRRPGLAAALCICLAGACTRPHLSAAAANHADKRPEPRAELRLDEIQPAPRFPAQTEAAPLGSSQPPDRRAARYLEKGRERFEQGLWNDAVTALEKGIQFEPGLIEAHLLLARAALQHGDEPLAKRHAEEVIHRDPRNPTAHQLLGEIAWRAGDPEGTVASFRLALMAAEEANSLSSPEIVLARLTLAFALHKQGYLTAAAEQLEAYLEAIDNPTPQVAGHFEFREVSKLYQGKAEALLGETYLALEDHDKAAGALKRASNLRPDDATMRRMLVDALLKGGQTDEALTVIRRWILDFPSQAEPLDRLREVCGMQSAAARETNAAADAANRQYVRELLSLAKFADEFRSNGDSIKAESDLSQLKSRIAGELINLDRPSDAIVILEPALTDEKLPPESRYLLAELYIRAQCFDDAYELVLQTLDLAPETFARAENVLAGQSGATSAAKPPRNQDVARSEPAGSRERASLATRLLPIARRMADSRSDAACHYALGLVLAAVDKTDESLQALRSAIELDARFAFAHVAAARIMQRQKRWEDSIAGAEAAIQGGVATADTYLIKAVAHDALYETKEAEAAFVEAFQHDRKNPEPLFRLAQSAARQQEPRRARQLYQRILDDIDPRFDRAREALIILYLNQGEYDRARDYCNDFKLLQQDGPVADRCRAMLQLPEGKDKTPQQRLDEYLSAIKKILKSYPNDAATHLEIATTCHRVHRIEEAIPYAKSALELEPDNVAALELMADLHARSLRFDRAATVWQRLVANRPRDEYFLSQWRDMALNHADYDSAARAQGRLLALPGMKNQPDKLMVLTEQLITLLENAGRQQEALEMLKGRCDESPNDPRWKSHYIELLSRAGHHDEAIALARKDLENTPGNTESRIRLLSCLQAAERFSEAKLLALDFLAESPDDLHLNLALILLCSSAKEWDDAIELSVTGAAAGQDRARYEERLVQTLVFAERYDEAAEFLRDKIGRLEHQRREANDPKVESETVDELEEANELLVGVLVNAERLEEAERLTNQLLRPHLADLAVPGNADIGAVLSLRNLLVRIFQESDRDAQAVQQMEAIYDLLIALGHRHDQAFVRPPPLIRLFVGICNDLGYTWADMGKNLDRAEEMIRYALAKEPRQAAYLDSLGWVLYKKGEFEDSAYYLNLAQAFPNGNDPIILDHLADALYRLNRRDEARDNWNKALALCQPDAQPPLNRERRLLHGVVQNKLKLLSENKPVTTAVVVEQHPEQKDDSNGAVEP